VAVSPGGGRALSGSHDRTLRWWDLGAGSCLRVLAGHTGFVTAVAVSPDGGRALSGSVDGTLRWWDLGQGKCIAVFTWDYPITSLSLALPRSDGRSRVVVGDPQGHVLFLELFAPADV
jgi:WD40 repeat protein